MIKALFFDIDGTLVPYGTGRIPEEVKIALEEVRRKGVKVFIATGRHKSWINNLDGAQFDGYVTVNGGMCLEGDGQTVISKTVVPPGDMERLARFARTTDMPLVVVPASDPIFITRKDEAVEHVASILKLPPIKISEVDSAAGQDVVQLMAFGSEEERRDSGLFSDVLLGCTATSWNPWFCDIIPQGSDKSKGIEAMARHFGFDISETVAFGDGSNDIGMLRAAGIGVAMGDAADSVKEAADMVTLPAAEGGIIHALQQLGLIEEPKTC